MNINRNPRRNTDLDLASLDTVEIVMALEEEFGIEIPDEDVAKFYNVDDIAGYIEQRTNQQDQESLLTRILRIIQQVLGRLRK